MIDSAGRTDNKELQQILNTVRILQGHKVIVRLYCCGYIKLADIESITTTSFEHHGRTLILMN